MKAKLIGAVLAALFVALGCQHTQNQPVRGAISVGKPSNAQLAPLLQDYRLGDAIESGNFAVIPVSTSRSHTQPDDQDYATLSEAKKNDWIEIIEKPGEEEVEFLHVRNTGPKPILLLGGELLLGGKQDRMVAEDTIVPPGKMIEVPVYCVEHGRWSGSDKKFSYSGSMVPSAVRRAGLYRNQEEVWSKVAEYNTKVGSKDGRSTVQAGLSDPKIRARVDSSMREVLAKLAEDRSIVGVVILINGEIQSFELFGSNRLFANSIESLLRGFIAEAAASSDQRPTDINAEVCEKFVSDALLAQKEEATIDASKGNASVSTGTIQGRAKMSDGAGESASIVHGSYSNK